MKQLPVLITIPHSSELLPEDVQERMLLGKKALREEIDPFSHQFFEVEGALIHRAPYSRLLVDMNRAADDFSPESGVVVEFSHTGEPFYEQPLERSEVLKRIEQYHKPYHDQLQQLLSGVKFLLDGHSCRPFDAITHADRADVILGSRDGKTCSPEMIKQIVAFLQSKGLSVSVDDPFRGRYIIDHYCDKDGVPGVQMEVNQGLYLEQDTLQRIPEGVARLKGVMEELVEVLFSFENF